MEKIAFLIGGQSVYWSSLVLLAAGIGASLVFLGCWLSRGGGFFTGIAALALSWCLGIPAARLMHWYCYAETYWALPWGGWLPSSAPLTGGRCLLPSHPCPGRTR